MSGYEDILFTRWGGSLGRDVLRHVSLLCFFLGTVRQCQHMYYWHDCYYAGGKTVSQCSIWKIPHDIPLFSDRFMSYSQDPRYRYLLHFWLATLVDIHLEYAKGQIVELMQ